MNPDVAAGIHNGQSTLTIYLTGGESDSPEPAEYAAQRQDGTRAAYARIAGVAESWSRQRVPVGQNRFIEVDALTARPDVQLAFLNLPEDNNPSAAGGKHALARLWQDSSETIAVRTLVPVSGVVRDSYTYRRADILVVLGALFETFRPTVIRTQDPQPDARYQPQWVGFHDHPDHVITARFAWEATQRYLGRAGRDALVVSYRDYNVAELPINLSVQDQQAKRDYFAAYVRYDAGADLGGSYLDWTIRSYYRWSRGGRWAGATSTGHLHAFAVYGTRLVHWWRDDHRRWYGPSVIPTPAPLRPALTLIPDHTGQLVLLAQTWDGAQVLLSRQGASPGAWQADWTHLGNPGPQPGMDPAQLGTPTAVTDRQGRLVVLMRNTAGSLSMRREKVPGGDWDEWSDLGGSDLQDPPTAVTDERNRLHVFAATRDRILHWVQRPSGSLQPTTTPFRKIQWAGPPVAQRAPGGETLVFARTGDSGALASVSVAPLFGWQVPARWPNPGGMGPLVVTTRHGPTGPEFLLFVRNSANGVSMRRVSPDGGDWTDLGGQIEDQPAAVVEPDGSITLLATGVDGRLLVNNELLGTAGPAFRGWQSALSWHSYEIRPPLVNGLISFRLRLLPSSTFCFRIAALCYRIRSESVSHLTIFPRSERGMILATSSVGKRCDHPALTVRCRFAVAGKRAVIRRTTHRPCRSTGQAAPARSEHSAIEPTLTCSERAVIGWTRGRGFGRDARLRPHSRATAVPGDNY